MQEKYPKILHCAICKYWAEVRRRESVDTPEYPYIYTVRCANVNCLSEAISTPSKYQSIIGWNENQRAIRAKGQRRSVSGYASKNRSLRVNKQLDDEYASIVRSISREERHD